MLKGFKDFIMRGNVVELAVGVVIGAAFTSVVNQFSKSFLTPLINMFGADSTKVPGTIELLGNPDNVITYGEFFGVVLSFLMTAAVVYFLVVLPLNKLNERRKKAAGETATEPSMTREEILLLREIRDALVAGRTPRPRHDDHQPSPRERV